MVARWDALLLAALLSGGSMLIEHSHRIDTGATDYVTAPASVCPDGIASGWSNLATNVEEDKPFSRSSATDDAAPAGCE